jgi:hypothetical protein
MGHVDNVLIQRIDRICGVAAVPRRAMGSMLARDAPGPGESAGSGRCGEGRDGGDDVYA